jgi:hypothetical protein
MRRSLSILAGFALLLAVPGVRAEEPFGAVSAPVLPGGSLALWGMGGYPELRAGFRQGLRSFEIGAQVGFDYLEVKAYAVAELRSRLWQGGDLQIALELAGGAFANAGARADDTLNQPGAGLRLGIGSVLTYKTAWPISLMAFLRLPVEVPLTTRGTLRVAALIGGAAEIAVSPSAFAVLQVGFGPELRRLGGGPELPLVAGAQGTRLAVQAMIGFGYRMF